MKKTLLKSAIAVALGTVALQANADLSTSAVLDFVAGGDSCLYGGTAPDNCKYKSAGPTIGSWFSMDANGNGTIDAGETTKIAVNDGVHMGTTQAASGTHAGLPDGTETEGLDAAWLFFSNTGLHFTTVAPTVVSENGLSKDLDFSGWRVTWNGIPSINMGGGLQNCGTATDGICVNTNRDTLGNVTGTTDIAGTFDNGTSLATITCDTASCSQSSTFVLDYAAVVPQADPSGFGGVPYALHLEGHVGTAAVIPVPAAAWLFGSGLLGLVGVARRKARA